jgi:hypothetical protein
MNKETDNPEWTDADFARARPFREVFPKHQDAWKRCARPRRRASGQDVSEVTSLTCNAPSPGEAEMVSRNGTRRTTPNQEILDVANQYHEASKILRDRYVSREHKDSGILLPLINTAAMAVELYVKSLSAEESLESNSGWIKIKPQPSRKGHRLKELYDVIEDSVKTDIEDAFRSRGSHGFLLLLENCEEAFQKSRYPFEKDHPLKVPNPKAIHHSVIQSVIELADFLAEFVNHRPVTEHVQP